MFCKNCGKEIDDKADICIYCGVSTKSWQEKAGETVKKTNGFGIAGFVVSLVSLWLGVYFCIASVVGLVLSIVAMVKRKSCTSCNGLAVAGLVLGIISLAIWGLSWMIAGGAMISNFIS